MNGKKENKKEFSGNVDKFYKVSKEKFVFKKGERLEILLKLKEESMRQGRTRPFFLAGGQFGKSFSSIVQSPE